MDLRKDKIDATLIFLVKKKNKHQRVLLAEKVRKIGIGCPNGFGGTINKKETPRACAIRELKKESGLIAMKEDLQFVGVMTFYNQRKDHSKFTVKVFIFILDKWRGDLKLKEDEMVNSKWYKTYRLPLKKMMPADKKFVPKLLNGEHVEELLHGEVWYGPEQKKVLGCEIKWFGKTGDVD